MKTTEDLARQAGLLPEDRRVYAGALERFAALVRAQAQEEAAQVADKYHGSAALAIRALAGPMAIPPVGSGGWSASGAGRMSFFKNRYWNQLRKWRDRPGLWRPKIGAAVPGHIGDPRNKLPGGLRRFARWYKLPVRAHKLYWRLKGAAAIRALAAKE